jgi:hypothetical protein
LVIQNTTTTSSDIIFRHLDAVVQLCNCILLTRAQFYFLLFVFGSHVGV